MLNGRQWPVLDGHGLGNGGERGIRTLGTLTRTTVFETAPFDHSGISPHKKTFIYNNLTETQIYLGKSR